jgi:hypothetical protein
VTLSVTRGVLSDLFSRQPSRKRTKVENRIGSIATFDGLRALTGQKPPVATKIRAAQSGRSAISGRHMLLKLAAGSFGNYPRSATC